MSSRPTTRSSTANAFAGPYDITSYDFNNLVSYKANPDYKGLLPAAKTETVNVKYYTDASNLKLDVQEGNIDVANRTLSATDIEDLRGNDNVKVVDGPGGEIRYLVFNFDTMPFGATTADADPAKALAVRQAIADLIDRDAISEDVYKGTFTPLYSYVPEGLAGANEALKGLYGDGNGAPDPDEGRRACSRRPASRRRSSSTIQYVAERYGPSSSDEYADHQGEPRVERPVHGEPAVDRVGPVLEDRVADLYSAFQLGWFPDYSDADNYLTPFFLTENFLVNHYDNPEVNDLILEQAVTTDPAAREALIGEIQDKVAADLSTIPYMQGAQVAVVGTRHRGRGGHARRVVQVPLRRALEGLSSD